MKTSLFAFALLSTGLATAAVAQSGPADADPLGGKTVTRAEMMAQAGTQFDQMDTNKDGKLDRADRAAEHGKKFDAMDTNKDGSLSRAEFDAAHQAMGEKRGERGKRGEGRMGGKRGEGRMAGMMLRMADANKDGAVSREEFQAARGKMFDTADSNKDGKLTPEERKAHHAQMRERMGKRGQRGPGGHGDHGAHGDMPPPPPAN